MALISYTSADEVRATLGISSKELDDATVALNTYETQLLTELDEISTGLNADYLTTSAISPGSRTAAQQRFVVLTQLFSTYSVSKALMSSQAMFSPKRITDGKAEVERFSDAYKFIREGLEINYANIKVKLALAYVAFGGIAVIVPARVYFQVSAGTDPVTGA